jgi:hypothetical protein
VSFFFAKMNNYEKHSDFHGEEFDHEPVSYHDDELPYKVMPSRMDPDLFLKLYENEQDCNHLSEAYTAVICAYNEAPDELHNRVGNVVREIKKDTHEIGSVIVADDGSHDLTAKVAFGEGATVISAPKNMGKAGIFNEAMALVKSPYTLLIDADLKELHPDIDRMIAAFEMRKKNNEYDMVIGYVDAMGQRFSKDWSGQRVAHTSALYEFGEIYPEVPGYALDAVLTKMMRDRGGNVLYHELPTIQHHKKSAKVGTMRAVWEYLSMWTQIQTTLRKLDRPESEQLRKIKEEFDI